jgi:protein-disulfide isomerase
MKRFVVLTLTVCAAAAAASSVRAAELVYFNSPACGVCERWDQEVGVIYDKTDEARRLPLRSVSVHDEKPVDLAHIKGVTFTPTFVVVEEGREVGRIVGYISDYFFWDQMAGLIKKAEALKNPSVTACSDPASSAGSSRC